MLTLNLGLIQISGPDTEKFLQGQLTCDIHQINSQQINLGAYCNHKGRVIAVFRIFLHKNNYYLLLPYNILENTLKTLKKYGAFSKITIKNVSNNFELITDHPVSKMLFQFKDENSWRLFNIEQGIPTIYPQTIEKFTPHMLNLPELNAVSFNKGCYLGQEIIARTEHLGKTKRQMFQQEINSEKNYFPGDEIYNDTNEKIGTLIDIAKTRQSNLVLLIP